MVGPDTSQGSQLSRAPYSYRADPSVPAFPDDKPIIVFDGHCALCSAWAQFVLRHDRARRYRLLPAQTPLGTALYAHYGLSHRKAVGPDPFDYETNLLIEDGRVSQAGPLEHVLRAPASAYIARFLGVNLFRGTIRGPAHAGTVAVQIDAEVRRLVDEAYVTARAILKQYRDQLDAVAKKLLEAETLTRDEFEAISPPPFPKKSGTPQVA